MPGAAAVSSKSLLTDFSPKNATNKRYLPAGTPVIEKVPVGVVVAAPTTDESPNNFLMATDAYSTGVLSFPFSIFPLTVPAFVCAAAVYPATKRAKNIVLCINFFIFKIYNSAKLPYQTIAKAKSLLSSVKIWVTF
ncbi:hypothetical protein D9M68_467490 [compost metagenome]